MSAGLRRAHHRAGSGPLCSVCQWRVEAFICTVPKLLCLNGSTCLCTLEMNHGACASAQDTNTHEPFFFPPSCSILYLLCFHPVPPLAYLAALLNIWNKIHRVSCFKYGSSVHTFTHSRSSITLLEVRIRAPTYAHPLWGWVLSASRVYIYVLLSVRDRCRRWAVVAHPAMLTAVVLCAQNWPWPHVPGLSQYIHVIPCKGSPITGTTVMTITTLMIFVLLHSVSLISSTSVHLSLQMCFILTLGK